jgi:O-methyltransferase
MNFANPPGSRILSSIKKLTIGLMQAGQIPISVFPFWYNNVHLSRNHYRPFLQQWREDTDFIGAWKKVKFDTIAFDDTAYILFSLARMACTHPGEIWECGVYKGGTATLLATARDCVKGQHTIRLFDTFQGMPERRVETDRYEIGSFGDTSLDKVKSRLSSYRDISFHQGFIPNTFADLQDRSICFGHVDVDQFETTRQCCIFIFQRLTTGGIMIIDDYGRPGTVGARLGADEALRMLNVRPLVLSTGQGVIIR